MKTSELTGNALNWAVNHAAGLTGQFSPMDYCGKWEHGGPIIEREGMTLSCGLNKSYAMKSVGYLVHEYGDTPLIAAMRCYVASKLGDDIDLPEELT